MLILAPIYIRVTPCFNYLSVLSQYLGAAGVEELPCCYNTSKIFSFKVFPHLQDLQSEMLQGQTGRQNGGTKRQTDKPFSSCQNRQLSRVSPQPKSRFTQHCLVRPKGTPIPYISSLSGTATSSKQV